MDEKLVDLACEAYHGAAAWKHSSQDFKRDARKRMRAAIAAINASGIVDEKLIETVARDKARRHFLYINGVEPDVQFVEDSWLAFKRDVAETIAAINASGTHKVIRLPLHELKQVTEQGHA